MKEYGQSNFSRTIMSRTAAQVLALMIRVMVVAVQILVFMAKAIRVVIINNLVRGLSSSSLVIRVT